MSLLLAPIYPQGAPPPGDVSFTDDEVDGYLAAAFAISYDGNVYHQTAYNRQSRVAYQWITPQVGMNLFECRATPIDTTSPTGTYGEWLDLGANAWVWYFQAVPTGRGIPPNTVYQDKQGTFLLEIRRKSDQVVVASGNVTVAMSGNA